MLYCKRIVKKTLRDLIMIELSQLRQLLQIAKSKTLSHAAEQLYISQPSLSRSMQRLEHDMGVELFRRSKNRIELNEAGELALTYARQIVDLSQAMVSALRSYQESKFTLRFTSCSPAPIWEISALAAYCLPTLTIAPSILSDSTALLDSLLKGKADLTVLPCPVSELSSAHESDVDCIPFLSEQLYVTLPLTHPLAGRDALTFADLNGESFLLRRHLGFWQALIDRLLPDSTFLPQKDDLSFNTVRLRSELLSFISDVVISREGKPANRVCIPLSDAVSHVTYYVCIPGERQARLSPLYEKLEARRLHG